MTNVYYLSFWQQLEKLLAYSYPAQYFSWQIINGAQLAISIDPNSIATTENYFGDTVYNFTFIDNSATFLTTTRDNIMFKIYRSRSDLTIGEQILIGMTSPDTNEEQYPSFTDGVLIIILDEKTVITNIVPDLISREIIPIYSSKLGNYIATNMADGLKLAEILTQISTYWQLLYEPYLTTDKVNGIELFNMAINDLESEPKYIGDIVMVLKYLGMTDDDVFRYIIYPSGRPRSEMSFITTKHHISDMGKYQILNSDANPERNWLISQSYTDRSAIIKKELLIPVVRYQKGMGYSGLYFEGAEFFCGTFYYFEPASDYYLLSTKTLITQNKMTAYYYLTGENSDAIKILQQAYFDKGIRNLAASPQKLFLNMLYGDQKVFKYNKYMYALEDIFDQRLCVAANNAGYDAIVLAYMTGSNRLVTEVLDVRRRDDSFNSIYIKPAAAGTNHADSANK